MKKPSKTSYTIIFRQSKNSRWEKPPSSYCIAGEWICLWACKSCLQKAFITKPRSPCREGMVSVVLMFVEYASTVFANAAKMAKTGSAAMAKHQQWSPMQNALKRRSLQSRGPHVEREWWVFSNTKIACIAVEQSLSTKAACIAAEQWSNTKIARIAAA